MNKPGTMACTCSPDCTYRPCIICGNECKWPGECTGKCVECGEPRTHIKYMMDDGFTTECDHYCSRACWDKHESAPGYWVKVEDLTPERFNELLNKNGLGLSGVGPVKEN